MKKLKVNNNYNFSTHLSAKNPFLAKRTHFRCKVMKEQGLQGTINILSGNDSKKVQCKFDKKTKNGKAKPFCYKGMIGINYKEFLQSFNACSTKFSSKIVIPS